MKLTGKLLAVLLIGIVAIAVIRWLGVARPTNVTRSEAEDAMRRATDAEDGRWQGGLLIPPTTQPTSQPQAQ